MLIELLYSSDASGEMSEGALVELLETSRRNNARTGITGMLLFHENSFLQLLEGEEADVLALYKTIMTDRRHTGSRVVWRGPIAARGFAEWTMAFRRLGELEPSLLDGYSPLLENGFTGSFLAQNPTAAQSLMRVLSNLD